MEIRQGVGVINEDAIAESWVADSGAWTILVINSKGLACIALHGDSWMKTDIDRKLNKEF